MKRRSVKDYKQYILFAKKYFDEKFPNGVDYIEVLTQESAAIRRFMVIYISSLKGKIAPKNNPEIELSRKDWFALKLISDIMHANGLKRIENLDFCVKNLEDQAKLLFAKTEPDTYKQLGDKLNDEITK